MSLDWQAFLDLADQLYNVAQQAASGQRQLGQQTATVQRPGPMSPNLIETYYRAATSRAYYSVFLQARAKVKQYDGVFYGGGDCHAALREHLRNSPRTGAPRIGNRLKDLHLARGRADYDDTLPVTPGNLANKALSEAKKTSAAIVQVFGP